MKQAEAGAPHPAALGLVWKIMAALGVPTLGVALLMWRDAALQAERLETLRGEIASIQSSLREHLDAERRRLDAAALAEREAAVAQARLQEAIASVKGQIDALLQALSRRRPG